MMKLYNEYMWLSTTHSSLTITKYTRKNNITNHYNNITNILILKIVY